MLPTLEKPHVIIVDDDLDMQDLISAYFRPKGFQVSCFLNAEIALNASLNSGTGWDVILSDLQLPRMSGIDFTVEIKKNLPNIPVILITALNSTETAVKAIQKGAYDFILKPIHFPQLLISINRALHFKALTGDISELRERVKLVGTNQGKIIGRSPNFLKALDIAKRVASSTANILISGESGSGKEVFAKFIHNESTRNSGPFIAINCSAIPENLLESELFGHAKGSFTGAHEKKVGLFEEAQDGTLFLDEIGDLSLPLQAKLLRVLQEKKIKRVGENQLRIINCRIISATHKDLAVDVSENIFREDLFFRLNVIPITIPPLRERSEDILPLAELFLKKFAIENASLAKFFSKESIKYILDNNWRGNVRELENAVKRAVVLSSKIEIILEDFLPSSAGLRLLPGKQVFSENCFSVNYERQLPTLDEIINKYLEFAVEKNNGARDKTAKQIGIDRKTLYKRLRSDSHFYQ